MIQRTLEPAAENAAAEAEAYLAMDHREVNEAFVADLFASSKMVGPRVLDLGCGPGLIAIEICNQDEAIEVMGMDLCQEMLSLARFELEVAGMTDRIQLVQDDACDCDSVQSDIVHTVVSNTVLHHLSKPIGMLRTAVKACQPGGQIFLRDLCRPDSVDEVEFLVDQYAGGADSSGLDGDGRDAPASPRQLLRQSLHAALTLEEARTLVAGLGIDSDCVQMTSDRHWTLAVTQPSS
ncbi:MAG: class I SAM-dependent methyltransferase [Planctomycetota bacterium]